MSSHRQLEEIVDVRRWQSDLEVARVRDHRELLSLGQRIESENAAINRELARQGATIAEVLTVIHVRDVILPASEAREARPLSSGAPSTHHLVFASSLTDAHTHVGTLNRISTLVSRMLVLPGRPSISPCRSRTQQTPRRRLQLRV